MKVRRCYFLLLAVCISCSTKSVREQSNAIETTQSYDSTNAIAIDTFKTGEVIPGIACLNNPANQIALYIPKETGPLPGVVFFFDPHGDPIIPLNKYKKLADEFKFIFIGSYNSKNGNDWNTTDQIWQTLIAEKRISYDLNRIYTAGFSGGAKVASYIALKNNNIKGVIANSAGLPETQQQMPTGNFSFLGITGTGDMNMTDMISLDQQLEQTNIAHQLLIFDGRHEWCPTETMHDAFIWIHFNEVKKSLMRLDLKWRDDFIALHNKKIEKLKKQNNLLDLVYENKLMAEYLKDGISDLNVKYAKAVSEIIKSPAYQKQSSEYGSLLEREKNIKSNLAAAIQQNTDENFWRTTINDLNKQASLKNTDAAMYNRVLSYLSLAGYSLSNRALNSGNNELAFRYISLYKLIDPSNSEAYYFSAILNAREKKFESAKADLQKAIDYGFNDWNRFKLQQEFSGIKMDELIR